MSAQELEKAMEQDPKKAIAHVVRNDLLVAHQLMKKAMNSVIEGSKLMSEAEHRMKGTIQSLQALLDKSRATALDRFVNPTGFEIRADACGNGRFGVSRNRDGKVYGHQGLDLVCLPGQDIRAPMAGKVVRAGLCYSYDQRWKLCVIEREEWEVKLLYVMVTLGLVGKEILAGDIIGYSQNISLKSDYKSRGMKPHIHVEVRRDGELLDPEPLMFS